MNYQEARGSLISTNERIWVDAEYARLSFSPPTFEFRAKANQQQIAVQTFSEWALIASTFGVGEITTLVFTMSIDDRHFEDYEVGAVFEFGPIEVKEAEIVSFAKRFDPQTMHIDPVKAAEGRYNGLIASGWHSVGLMMQLPRHPLCLVTLSVLRSRCSQRRQARPLRVSRQSSLIGKA